MFTGIVEELGAVCRRSGPDLTIMAKKVLSDGPKALKETDSVAVNGVCLTVAAKNENSFAVQLSPETLQRTTLGQLRLGDAVNLERALAVGDRLGGHFVQGHVDGVGRVKSVRRQGEFSFWQFEVPAEVRRYLLPRGSIAVDGISLTVTDVTRDGFEVAVIPATYRNTTLMNRPPGDLVNLEADMIAKHIYHYLNRREAKELSWEFLAKHGFA